ncbi:ferredoxin [Streptomyces sp. NPDC057963]|uniref:ferredoxin n=1 Tax=Streptomyces sp. NPDC057963 TaxID=3346290 RepID=UPI0036EA572A
MRIKVDSERCMGHAMCNALAPEVYTVTDDGFNEMPEFEVAADRRAAALRGASACPERIIAVLADEAS